MSKADVLFVNMCRDIIEHGFSTEGMPVRPHWEDGAGRMADPLHSSWPRWAGRQAMRP